MMNPPSRSLHPPRMEILGSAGSGKTTLTRALLRMDPSLQVGLGLSKFRVYPRIVNRSLALLPTFVMRSSESRWFSWKETKAIMFMDAWRRALARDAAPDSSAIVFDHGPFFWLTRLREFGPAFMKSDRAEAWWRGEVGRWASLLDVLILLDAPDGVLASRIRMREGEHIVKRESDESIRRFLHRFRAAFTETISLAAEAGCLTRVEFDSGSRTPEDIAASVLTIIERRAGASGTA